MAVATPLTIADCACALRNGLWSTAAAAAAGRHLAGPPQIGDQSRDPPEAVPRQQHVRWLQVPVCAAVLVHVGNASRQPKRDSHRWRKRHLPSTAGPLEPVQVVKTQWEQQPERSATLRDKELSREDVRVGRPRCEQASSSSF